MKMLDLFCGAGGSAMGLAIVGFKLYGVDHLPQPNYPFTFILDNALTFPLEDYDAYWASPPCQAYSEATPITTKYTHPRLIPIVRSILKATGKPYVIENVEGARKELIEPLKLCGTMFELGVWRHRYFEIGNMPSIESPAPCFHIGHPVTVNPPQNARRAQGGKRDFNKEQLAMRIDWMTKTEIAQAIPPAYSEYIGKFIIDYIRSSN